MASEGFDLISGDWLFDSERDGYTRVYEGIVTGGWSGGVEFIASRAVVEQIVAEQERLVAEQMAAYPDSPVEESIGRLVWDGDVLVQYEVDGETYRHEPLDSERNYSVGFGWIWSPVEDDDRFFEVVRNDGTVEQNELQDTHLIRGGLSCPVRSSST